MQLGWFNLHIFCYLKKITLVCFCLVTLSTFINYERVLKITFGQEALKKKAVLLFVQIRSDPVSENSSACSHLEV